MEEELRAIEFLKNVCTDECVNKEFVVKPILNLIEKLKEENKKLNNMYRKEYNEHMEMKRQNGVLRNNERILKDNCIPISVIQNKIDEIKESMNKSKSDDLSYIEYCEDRIQVLQELLNERK